MATNVGFFGMLHQIYNAVGSAASAVNRVANAADNLGKWSEAQTAAFVDEAEFERQIKLDALKAKRLKYQAEQKQMLIDVGAPAIEA